VSDRALKVFVGFLVVVGFVIGVVLMAAITDDGVSQQEIDKQNELSASISGLLMDAQIELAVCESALEARP